MEMKSIAPPLFTATSAGSLGAVVAVGLVAYIGAKTLLPRNAKWQDRLTFIWFVSQTFSPSNFLLYFDLTSRVRLSMH